jgi:integrase
MQLPPKVRVKHGRYYFDAGRDESGKRRWLPLSRVSDGDHAMYAALARVTRPQGRTVGELFDAFLGEMQGLAPATQRDYLGYITRALRPVFGEMSPEDVKPSHIAQYLERREKSGAGVVANREIACLSSAYNFAMRRGWVEANPCRGARRNRERPKDRYVRDDEFLQVFNPAPEALQDYLAVLYLTGLRPGEARALRAEHITPEGLRMEESKTGKVRRIDWSEPLRFFILRARSRTPGSPYLLTNSRGEPWTEWAVYSALRRIRDDLKAKGIEAAHWSPHSLRAKAESDSKEGLGLLPLYKRMRRTKPVR